mmetsp:Transcript_26726/g.74865  ORF Transcript_26726/g.74865 Transcript_26726/m.74865 type:complete len:258 (-) Transcript_26726:743-1516(-)
MRKDMHIEKEVRDDAWQDVAAGELEERALHEAVGELQAAHHAVLAGVVGGGRYVAEAEEHGLTNDGNRQGVRYSHEHGSEVSAEQDLFGDAGDCCDGCCKCCHGERVRRLGIGCCCLAHYVANRFQGKGVGTPTTKQADDHVGGGKVHVRCVSRVGFIHPFPQQDHGNGGQRALKRGRVERRGDILQRRGRELPRGGVRERRCADGCGPIRVDDCIEGIVALRDADQCRDRRGEQQNRTLVVPNAAHEGHVHGVGRS